MLIWIVLFCMISIILGVGYMFYFYCWIVFGEIKLDDVCDMKDMDSCELWLLVLIVVVVLWMGVYFESFLVLMCKDVSVLF